MRRLRLPRRPAWSEEQSAEAVDAQERGAFVEWRRALAAVEEGERLVLTPFEKNLEVWRQLWRVLERSHIVVQARRAACARPLLCDVTAVQARRMPLHTSTEGGMGSTTFIC